MRKINNPYGYTCKDVAILLGSLILWLIAYIIFISIIDEKYSENPSQIVVPRRIRHAD
jgi:hypothetical protein